MRIEGVTVRGLHSNPVSSGDGSFKITIVGSYRAAGKIQAPGGKVGWWWSFSSVLEPDHELVAKRPRL